MRAEGITLLVSINGHVRTRALGLKNTKHFGTGGAIAGTWLEWRAPFRKTMTLPTATMISRVDLCRGPMLVRKSPGASRHFCMDLWRQHHQRGALEPRPWERSPQCAWKTSKCALDTTGRIISADGPLERRSTDGSGQMW